MDEALEHRVRRLQFTCRKPVNELLAGEYLSVFKGKGIEFDEVRAYQPGDDVRSIDWNVTARTGFPHVKNFIEERELTLYLLFDSSASFSEGAIGQSKRRAAVELAALLAYSANRNNDRVGSIQFTSHVEQYIPPAKGEAHIRYLLEELLRFKPQRVETDVSEALTFLENITRKRCIVFLFSDFQSPDYREAVQVIARHHDLVTVSVYDEYESKLPDVGLLTLRDNESGAIQTVDTCVPGIRKSLAKRALERQQRLVKDFEEMNVDHLEVHTQSDYVQELVVFFETRKQRGGHVATG